MQLRMRMGEFSQGTTTVSIGCSRGVDPEKVTKMDDDTAEQKECWRRNQLTELAALPLTGAGVAASPRLLWASPLAKVRR